jgi:hypothetical protein
LNEIPAWWWLLLAIYLALGSLAVFFLLAGIRVHG